LADTIEDDYARVMAATDDEGRLPMDRAAEMGQIMVALGGDRGLAERGARPCLQVG
jgi:hypothetical protein